MAEGEAEWYALGPKSYMVDPVWPGEYIHVKTATANSCSHLALAQRAVFFFVCVWCVCVCVCVFAVGSAES